MNQYTRRKFLIQSAYAFPGAALAHGSDVSFPPIAKVMNAAPSTLVDKAIEMIGGISSFIKSGQSVLIKPNIGWDRIPEQAATTNPEIVAKVIELCQKAGASKVRVIDRTCNSARRCYRRSGIEAAVRKAGAEIRFIAPSRFKNVTIPSGVKIKEWPIYKDALDFDVLINIPIAKVHSLSKVTLGMKNLMGLLGGDRGGLHEDFDEKIVDINSVLRPTLTIVDAYRVLLRNGPSGGSLQDVAKLETVIASPDIVAADAAAVALLGLKPEAIPHLLNAQNRGLGSCSQFSARLKQFDFRA